MGKESIRWKRMSSVEKEDVTWLWPGWIPLGMLSIIDGDPGLGKSTLLLDIAARVTTHGVMPDGTQGAQGNVIMLSAEDHLSKTTAQRIENCGADPFRVVYLHDIRNEKSVRPISLPKDFPMLSKIVKREGVKFIIADTLLHYMDCDANSDREVKHAMHRFKSWVEKRDVAFTGIRHMNKAGSMKAMYRGSGSIAIIGAARCALVTAQDPDDDTRCILAMNKTNVGPKPPSLYYKLVQAENKYSKVKWEGVCGMKVDEVLAAPLLPEERGAREDACAFLREILTQGPMLISIAKAQAKDAQISDKTLRWAREKLKIKTYQRSYGTDWMWALPTHEGQDRNSGARSDLDETQANDPGDVRE